MTTIGFSLNRYKIEFAIIFLTPGTVYKMEEIKGRFPVQSLYYCCLNYLRKNHMLINFTALSVDVGDDIAAIMHNHTHLKKFRLIPYRNVSTHNFESYIYKYYFEEMRVDTDPDEYLRELAANGDFKEYIPGILTFEEYPDIIYEPKDGKFYYTHCFEKRHKYKNKILMSILEKLYPDVKLYYYNEIFCCGNESYYKIFSEEFFDRYPGLAEWAEKEGYISEKLWIPENLLKN